MGYHRGTMVRAADSTTPARTNLVKINLAVAISVRLFDHGFYVVLGDSDLCLFEPVLQFLTIEFTVTLLWRVVVSGGVKRASEHIRNKGGGQVLVHHSTMVVDVHRVKGAGRRTMCEETSTIGRASCAYRNIDLVERPAKRFFCHR